MQTYANYGGDSGVVGFECEADRIVVYFRDGSAYSYGPMQPGAHHVREMRRLAEAGEGLNGYINIHVKSNYEAKLS